MALDDLDPPTIESDLSDVLPNGLYSSERDNPRMMMLAVEVVRLTAEVERLNGIIDSQAEVLAQNEAAA
jgi:hypothetical protein